MREIINAIFYVMRSGCPWRLIPVDLPPWSTVYRWFAAWRDACVFERINYTLVMADRESIGREASPSAAIIDSQSVKTTEAGGPRGYDACKKVNGRKRHALVDTDGRALVLELHPASIQNRDGGGHLLCTPIVATTMSESRTPRTSSSKLYENLPTRSASSFCRAHGWSRGSSRGSVETEAGKGFRSLNRLGKGLPLRRLCHAPHSSYCQAGMNF